jgi:hypothetical protein
MKLVAKLHSLDIMNVIKASAMVTLSQSSGEISLVYVQDLYIVNITMLALGVSLYFYYEIS